VRKSLSVEDTFPHDIHGAEQCLDKLTQIHAEFLRRLARETEKPSSGMGRYQLFVKIKYGDFRQTTIERAYPSLALTHFQNLFLERYGANPKSVRLLGLGLRWPDPQDLLQLSLPLDTEETKAKAS